MWRRVQNTDEYASDFTHPFIFTKHYPCKWYIEFQRNCPSISGNSKRNEFSFLSCIRVCIFRIQSKKTKKLKSCNIRNDGYNF